MAPVPIPHFRNNCNSLDGGAWCMQTYLEGHLGQAIVCLQWILQAHAYNILKIDMSNKRAL